SLGRSSPASNPSSVDLPDPDAPVMATDSPAPTVNDTSSRMVSQPSASRTRLPRCSTIMASMYTNPFRVERRRFLETLIASGAAVAASLPARARGAGASAPAASGAAAESPAAPSAAASPAASASTVLVLGDSLSAEYGLRRGTGWVERAAARLREQRPPWQLVNASISGETSSGGRSRIDALLRRHEPQIVVVELGGNDALRGLDL